MFVKVSLDALFPQANINLFSLRDYLCADGKSLMIRACSEVDHIFSELYNVDERIRIPYYTIKIIELFLFLGLVERKKFENLPSFSRSVVSATKSVYAYLIENPIKRVTIAELSFRFNVTAAFKSVYKQTPFVFRGRNS